MVTLARHQNGGCASARLRTSAHVCARLQPLRLAALADRTPAPVRGAESGKTRSGSPSHRHCGTSEKADRAEKAIGRPRASASGGVGPVADLVS